MKKTLLFVSITITMLGNAQQMDQSNEPTIGALSTLYLCDSFATNMDAVTGSGVTWDYSTIGGYSGQTRDIEVVDPSLTTYASDFPTSQKTYYVGSNFKNYYASTASQKTSQGFVFTEPTFGDVIAKFDTDEQIVATYPFALGNSIADVFSGTLIYQSGTQTTTATGNGEAVIDGQGTLMAGASSVPNVIRYKLVDTSYATVSNPFPISLQFVRNQYEYYDYASSNLPVFVHSTISVSNVGAPNPISEQTLVLSAYAPTGQVGLTEMNKIDFKLYPNPATDKLFVGGISKDAVVEIIDQSGRIVLSTVQGSGYVDISSIDKGMYIVNVKDGNSVGTQSLVKQ